MRSIYKSDEGRRVMQGWYDSFESSLEQQGFEFEHRQVSTRYGDTNVVMAGPLHAPPLVCFHGAMASSMAALKHMPGLLSRFRVIFPDTIGQPGRSDERRLDWQGTDHGHWAVDVLDALELETVTAFGVSLGGYVILRLIEIAPERVSRAVLWAPAGLIKPSFHKMFGLIFDGLIYNMAPSEARLRKVLTRTFTDLDEEYVRFFADSLEHVHPDRRFPQVLPTDAVRSWAGEAMLITNENDSVFPSAAILDRAERELPQVVEATVMPGFAHMPPFSGGSVDALLDRVDEFVRR